jgi:hypothetical protein
MPIRGEIEATGIVFRLLQDGTGISVTYIVQVDPRGWLPASVVNASSSDQAMNALRICQIYGEYWQAYASMNVTERVPLSVVTLPVRSKVSRKATVYRRNINLRRSGSISFLLRVRCYCEHHNVHLSLVGTSCNKLRVCSKDSKDSNSTVLASGKDIVITAGTSIDVSLRVDAEGFSEGCPSAAIWENRKDQSMPVHLYEHQKEEKLEHEMELQEAAGTNQGHLALLFENHGYLQDSHIFPLIELSQPY